LCGGGWIRREKKGIYKWKTEKKKKKRKRKKEMKKKKLY
jgi:hypothetical protein